MGAGVEQIRGMTLGQWLPSAGPRTLAALRIATGLAILPFIRGVGFVLPPQPLRFPPSGTAWLGFLPASDLLFEVAVRAAGLAALALIVGWHSRWAAWVALAGIFYAGWVTTLTGKVDHSHHLMWVLLILAVSPCANNWAVRRENRPGSYRWPVFAVMVLLGLIYFGAGLQKLASAGLAWGWSDNLKNTVLTMGWEKNQPVHQWLVDWPVTGRLLGSGALMFELAFLPLILIPTTRKWVWPAGLIFHWGTWLILGISFVSLQYLYVVFLPWGGAEEVSSPTDVQRRLIVALVAVVAVFSLSGIDRAWPVAAYPGFDGIRTPFISDFEILVGGDAIFVTDSTMASTVGPQRILPLMHSAISAGAVDQLVAWLEAEELTRVVIDARTGAIVERELLYRSE